jgi:hypothetical protein
MQHPLAPLVSSSLPEICPECQPRADLMYAGVSWCGAHQPDRKGKDDLIASPFGDLPTTGSAESGGDDNRAMCDLLHRGRDA